MLNKVKSYICKHNLFDNGKYIVALSGGADSVCLLRMMLALGYDVEAAHCNFKLRGKESDRDEKFCINLCSKLNVPIHIIHFDTKEYASLHKVSIEMAARELRYSYFEQLRVAIGAKGVVVAHHSDDNVETVLLNLIRGTGIYGLEGIKPRNGYILRPLLCLSRKDILNYLRIINQDFVTDSSNNVDDVQRNKVRLNLIPVLQSIMPEATKNILVSVENISQAVKVYSQAIEECISDCFKGNVLNIERLKAQSSPEAVLYEILKRYGFSSKTIKQIYDNIDAPTGKTWSNETYTVAKDRDVLVIDCLPREEPSFIIPETGIYRINGGDNYMRVQVSPRTDFVSKEPLIATLDADRVRFPLILRQVRNGDKFVPYGMKGAKLVSDYLTDRKRNFFQRRLQLVVEDATGKIIWLVGERVSNDASVSIDTIKVLTLRYSKE